MPNPSPELLKAIAVTAELTNTELSREAAKLIAQDLTEYPELQVFGALRRCRRELTGKLTLAHILARIDDGRPGPDEAWAIVGPTIDNEHITVIWTDEMAEAFGVARHLADDHVAARMAFREAYSKLVAEGRDRKTAPAWSVSLGWDAKGREGPIREAVEKHRISQSHGSALLPNLEPITPLLESQVSGLTAHLTHERTPGEDDA